MAKQYRSFVGVYRHKYLVLTATGSTEHNKGMFDDTK
jgi:hypothetical protein